MNKVQYQVSDRDVLDLVRADSDVAIKGWDEDFVELSLDGEIEDCQVEQQEGTLVINSQVALAVSVPCEMHVHIGQVRGDLVASNLESELSVEEAYGDCDLRSSSAKISIGSVRGSLDVEETANTLTVKEARSDVRLTNTVGFAELGQVGGDFRARDVGGGLKLGTIQGDARVRDARGVVTIEEAVGDFRGTDLRAGMNVHVRGDLTLKTVLAPDTDYLGSADGDISAHVPADSSARFTLKAKGGISTRLLRVEEMESGCVEGQMGDGEARVVLESDGHLALKPIGGWDGEFGEFGANFGEFGTHFGESIAAQVEAQIAEQLQGMHFDDLARVEMEKAMAKLERDMAKIQHRAGEHARQAEELARQAHEKARRVQEKARRAAGRAARRQAEKRGRQFHIQMSADHLGQRARPKVSQEEQLSILRMLQEGKISAEEAEMLLKALEG
ncbi:MAG: hypothetical protein JXA89_09775 [Anaerolineae bacterium]|nr:hypothetical protein [Anaerolineae bacterium]